MTHQLHCGNNAEVLKQYPDSHFDSIITDPPYGIEFLGKDWDSHTGTVETWQQCLRVLKPGGHLLAFSAARTYHHLATNIESVGFEIRDQLMWIYSSGFPKAQDIGKAIQKRQGVEKTEPHKTNVARIGGSQPVPKANQNIVPTSPEAKQWHGWKTALKPGHEPIVMARRPFKGSTIDNVLQHGVGALNIDATRIGNEIVKTVIKRNEENSLWYGKRADDQSVPKQIEEKNNMGRYPSNVLGDIPDYQKYFYCGKVSRRERHVGFEQSNIPTNPSSMYDVDGTGVMYNPNKKDSLAHLPTEFSMLTAMGGYYVDDQGQRTENTSKNIWTPQTGMVYVHGLTKIYAAWCQTHNKTSAVGNNHPTVKPVALMRYLIQLVTPANSTVLDPFMGSGSTGMAAVELGHRFVGIDLDANYVSIADRRILGWCTKNPIETKTKTESHMVAVTKPHSAFDRLFE